MTWTDWLGMGCTLLMIALLIVWNIQYRREAKSDAAKRELEEAVLERMELGVQGLKHAALTSLWAKHHRYDADDTSLPGLITVKCSDCGESIGTAETEQDVLSLAHKHVMDKYDEILKDVAEKDRIAAQVEALKEDATK